MILTSILIAFLIAVGIVILMLSILLPIFNEDDYTSYRIKISIAMLIEFGIILFIILFYNT